MIQKFASNTKPVSKYLIEYDSNNCMKIMKKEGAN